MAAITAWVAANQGAAAIIVGVLAILGFINKDKIKALIDKVTGKTEDTATDAKAKASAVGDKVKAKFEDVIGDVTGIVGAVDSSALQLGTLALREHYLKHVATEDQAEVNTAFQALLNINAKLPKTPAISQ